MNTNIPRLPSWQITPEEVYLNRRSFMGGALLAAGAAALAACVPSAESSPGAADSGSDFMKTTVPEGGSDELGNPSTSYASVVQYNNFYEFSTDKAAVARLAQNFRTSPWTVEVGGLVHKPRLFDIEDIRRMFGSEERIYRMRCVEGWSMVIPWLGFPLSQLLDEVEPMGSARYVRFETLLDEEQMPGTRSAFYPWAYQEGLRIDEAAHPLTMLSTGLYGSDLLPQSGAPVRLVIPWKYGFKSIKSIVKIELVEEMPSTFWNIIAPHEYGFYANVNPQVHHPRWSQASERRIGESGRTPTLMFNGYAEQVASLYAGMDLAQQY